MVGIHSAEHAQSTVPVRFFGKPCLPDRIILGQQCVTELTPYMSFTGGLLIPQSMIERLVFSRLLRKAGRDRSVTAARSLNAIEEVVDKDVAGLYTVFEIGQDHVLGDTTVI